MDVKYKKRLLGLAILVVAIGITFLLIRMQSPPARKKMVDTRPVVSTIRVENTPIQLTVPVIGKLVAREKIDIHAEVSGVLEASDKPFLEGITFRKGEILIKINSDEKQLSLQALRSNLMTSITKLLPELKFDYPESYKTWEEYLSNCAINTTTRPLPQPLNDREKYFVAGKGIYRTYYDIKSQESRLQKYTIRAPFDGVVVLSTIKPGNLIMVGQKLGTFINPTVYEMEVTVPVEDVSLISPGNKVSLFSETISGEWTGEIVRIGQSVDELSQMVRVFIAVSGQSLKEGMYLRGTIETSTTVDAFIIPRKLLVKGDTVLTIQEGIIRPQKVYVHSQLDDRAIISGLPEGTLISQKTQNLYDGTVVKIDGDKSVIPGEKKDGDSLKQDSGSKKAPKKKDSV